MRRFAFVFGLFLVGFAAAARAELAPDEAHASAVLAEPLVLVAR